MSVTHQQQLIEIMETLDDIKILHNDGNVLNLMLDDKDNLKLIDFGMARRFKDEGKGEGKETKLNGGTTLYMMRLGFKRYGIKIGTDIHDYIEDSLERMRELKKQKKH
jgi:serine/threonine protein kinase